MDEIYKNLYTKHMQYASEKPKTCIVCM